MSTLKESANTPHPGLLSIPSLTARNLIKQKRQRRHVSNCVNSVIRKPAPSITPSPSFSTTFFTQPQQKRRSTSFFTLHNRFIFPLLPIITKYHYTYIPPPPPLPPLLPHSPTKKRREREKKESCKIAESRQTSLIWIARHDHTNDNHNTRPRQDRRTNTWSLKPGNWKL